MLPLSMHVSLLSTVLGHCGQHWLCDANVCFSTGQSSGGQVSRLHTTVELAHVHSVHRSGCVPWPDGVILSPNRHAPLGGSINFLLLPVINQHLFYYNISIDRTKFSYWLS